MASNDPNDFSHSQNFMDFLNHPNSQNYPSSNNSPNSQDYPYSQPSVELPNYQNLQNEQNSQYYQNTEFSLDEIAEVQPSEKVVEKKPWCVAEDKALMSAWIFISGNAIKGKNRKRPLLWGKIE